jgi:SWI/SNF-related matrix-associated actin-dependent regulator of chromatin subfamily A member 5
LKEEGETGPYLIVCPLSVLETWQKEAKRWVPSLSVFVFHGQESFRQRLKEDCSKNCYDLYLTTYEQYVAEQGKYSNFTLFNYAYQISGWFRSQFVWKYVILDEGHRIRNSSSMLANSLHSIQTQYRLILTGTPIQNNLTEIWGLLHWLYPKIFTSDTSDKFTKSFDLNKGSYDLSFIETSRALLQTIMLRRTKESVEAQCTLPRKEEITIFLPLSPMQHFWYVRLIDKLERSTSESIFQPSDNVQLDTASLEGISYENHRCIL